LHDSVPETALRVIQGQHENSGIGHRESTFGEVDILSGAWKFRHIHREVGICHHSRERIHDYVCIASSSEIKREVIAWVVERPKKGDALYMVQMKMAEKNMSAYGVITELLQQFISEEPNACPAIKDEDLIRVRPYLDA